MSRHLLWVGELRNLEHAQGSLVLAVALVGLPARVVTRATASSRMEVFKLKLLSCRTEISRETRGSTAAHLDVTTDLLSREIKLCEIVRLQARDCPRGSRLNEELIL